MIRYRSRTCSTLPSRSGALSSARTCRTCSALIGQSATGTAATTYGFELPARARYRPPVGRVNDAMYAAASSRSASYPSSASGYASFIACTYPPLGNQVCPPYRYRRAALSPSSANRCAHSPWCSSRFLAEKPS